MFIRAFGFAADSGAVRVFTNSLVFYRRRSIAHRSHRRIMAPGMPTTPVTLAMFAQRMSQLDALTSIQQQYQHIREQVLLCAHAHECRFRLTSPRRRAPLTAHSIATATSGATTIRVSYCGRHDPMATTTSMPTGSMATANNNDVDSLPHKVGPPSARMRPAYTRAHAQDRPKPRASISGTCVGMKMSE